MIISIRKMESVLKCFLLSVLFLGFTNIFSIAAGNSEVLYTGKQVVVEGESFTITCVTDLFQNIKWQKDLRPIVGDLAKQFNITLHQDKFEIISTLSTSHAQTSHSGSYRCGPFLESYHIYVLSANSITVNYDPDSTKYKTIDFKSPLEIQCNTTESDTRMEWYKNDTKLTSTSRIKIEDNRLVIEKPEVEDAGNYTCKLIHTKGPGNGTVSSSADIRVVVKPQVGTQKDVTVVEGEKLKLECAVIGSPTPTIVWKFGNNTYNQSTERVQLVEYGGVPNAALIINEATMDDRGNYVCSASTETESDISTSTVYVRVKDKLAALWPFLGICAEVFVLCAIILIYEKKRNKTELEESDTDNSPETKNTPDHGKDSVRQRK